jgi:hypothetical protein
MHISFHRPPCTFHLSWSFSFRLLCHPMCFVHRRLRISEILSGFWKQDAPYGMLNSVYYLLFLNTRTFWMSLRLSNHEWRNLRNFVFWNMCFSTPSSLGQFFYKNLCWKNEHRNTCPPYKFPRHNLVGLCGRQRDIMMQFLFLFNGSSSPFRAQASYSAQ